MAVNLKSDTGFSFQNLLYSKFILKHHHRVDSTSDSMGIHKDTLYRKIRGENDFKIDELPALLNATNDIEYINFLLRDTNFIAIPKPDKRFEKMLSELAKNLLAITGNGLKEK